MKHINLKFIVFFLIIGLNYSGILAVGQALAYFNDIENSSGSLFEAGVIDFVLNDKGFDPIEPSVSLEPGDITFKNIDVIPEPESNPFQYYASTTNFSGDEDFCDALNVDAKVESSSMYVGDLKGLLTGATTTLPSWSFEIGMGTNNLQNKVCNFDIVYNGWQTRHNYPTYENGGFSDTEQVSNTISSWGFRLNKIYYDVASDRGVEGDNEWVEIFNQTSVPLDITGWQICDNNSCDVIPASDPIPAMGYGVITPSSATWGYWYVPSEIVRIVLDDARIGSGLNNDGDALYLKRPDGYVVDEMNWQGNTDVWNPGAVDVAKGNTLARVPNGYDTDQASDWVELVPPVVDLINPDEAGSYTWYWTYSYEIQWTAVNPNGDDADLAIDLYYIKDVNGDGEISAGDTKHNIVMGTANDGSHWWTVPSGFLGYIWIELVATGPENPMLNAKTVSGDIWDPIPIFLWENDPQAVLDALENPDDAGEGEVLSEEELLLLQDEVLEDPIRADDSEESASNGAGEEEVYPVVQTEADGTGEETASEENNENNAVLDAASEEEPIIEPAAPGSEDGANEELPADEEEITAPATPDDSDGGQDEEEIVDEPIDEIIEESQPEEVIIEDSSDDTEDGASTDGAGEEEVVEDEEVEEPVDEIISEDGQQDGDAAAEIVDEDLQDAENINDDSENLEETASEENHATSDVASEEEEAPIVSQPATEPAIEPDLDLEPEPEPVIEEPAPEPEPEPEPEAPLESVEADQTGQAESAAE